MWTNSPQIRAIPVLGEYGNPTWEQQIGQTPKGTDWHTMFSAMSKESKLNKYETHLPYPSCFPSWEIILQPTPTITPFSAPEFQLPGLMYAIYLLFPPLTQENDTARLLGPISLHYIQPSSELPLLGPDKHWQARFHIVSVECARNKLSPKHAKWTTRWYFGLS